MPQTERAFTLIGATIVEGQGTDAMLRQPLAEFQHICLIPRKATKQQDGGERRLSEGVVEPAPELTPLANEFHRNPHRHTSLVIRAATMSVLRRSNG